MEQVQVVEMVKFDFRNRVVSKVLPLMEQLDYSNSQATKKIDDLSLE